MSAAATASDVLSGAARWCALEGDGLFVLAGLPGASVDTVTIDPPYCSGGVSEASRTASTGQGLRSENLAKFGWFVGDNMTTAGLVWLLRSTAFEALRVVKPSGSLLVFADWRMVPNLGPAIESAGWRYQNLIVWNKGSMGLGTGFRAQHEMVLHYTAGAPVYHHKGTSNVITVPRVTGDDREHQTQKPVRLMRELLRVVSPVDGVVVDTFAGSGSTGVAALEEGMRAILCERAAAHVETIRERCAAVATGVDHRAPVEQGRLFSGAA
mgnify:FL=1